MQQAAALAAVAAIQAGGNPAMAQTEQAKQLEAGVAVAEITPPLGAPLWGYTEGVRLAESVRDPLHARVLALRSGGTTVALAALELGRVPVAEACARIRERARQAGVDHVFFCATHTHSGPVMEMPGLPYLEDMEQAIGKAVLDATAALVPARVGLAKGTIDIGHNRRVIKDGKCHMLWRNADREPTSPVDKETAVIRVETAQGKPMAVLVHYACHPVIFGADHKQFSADWPGEMGRVVEAAVGAPCFFLQGACGDINPYLDKTPMGEGAVESMLGEGRKAGQAVLEALENVTPCGAETPGLAFREERIEAGLRWDLSNPEQAAILKAAYGPMYDVYIKDLKPDLSVPVGALVINNQLALAFLPGEFFVQFQLDLKAASPLPNSLLCGYANEYHAYFPTVRGAAMGGYGGLVPTYVAPGAGERTTTAAAVMIGEIAGMLRTALAPSDLVFAEVG